MSTGYVDPNHDYTQEDQIDADDFELVSEATATKTADQVENENTFPHPPPGRQLLYVSKFIHKMTGGQPPKRLINVYLDGEAASFESHEVVAVISMVGSPRHQVTDRFLLPPIDPREHRAYFEGKREKTDTKVGQSAAKYMHFIGKGLGFTWGPGEKIPAEAGKLKAWKHFLRPDGSPCTDRDGNPIIRSFYAVIQAPKDWLDKKTNEMKTGYAQVKMFSYELNPAQVVPADYKGAYAPLPAHPGVPALTNPAAIAASGKVQAPKTVVQAPRQVAPPAAVAATIASSGLDDV